MSNYPEAHYVRKARNYLHYLCEELPDRRTGSAANRKATRYFAKTIGEFGFQVETPSFDCLDWISGASSLVVGSEGFPVHISPHSAGIQVQAPLLTLETHADLAASTLEGRIALLKGELTREQLMPKNFPFYNPEHHKQIIRRLESKRPAAIIAATGRDAQMAGGVYPFPLIEDGDFNIPSVYMTELDGERLAAHDGEVADLIIDARRIPATGYNVVARSRRGAHPRLVLCAHIDAKDGTPGALDNAAGVITLLLLAERLQAHQGSLMIEIVALNGEDYYAASGEIQYIEKYLQKPQDVLLAINIDGAGYLSGNTAYSLYDCPDKLSETLSANLSRSPGLVEGSLWYQSDHSIFIQNGVPAMALTSDRFDEIWASIAHTAEDRPENVDIMKLVHLSALLHDLIAALNHASGR